MGGVAISASYSGPGALGAEGDDLACRSCPPCALFATSARAGSVMGNLAPLSRSTNWTSDATMRS